MENRELIAEFMGEQIAPVYIQGGKSGLMVFKKGNYKYVNYDKSWDWLMPVVEKIESLGFVVDIVTNMTDIYRIHPMGGKKVNSFFGYQGSKIEKTYTAIVEFIQWHNIQNHA